MSAYRRAAAPRLVDWTGERCVPWTPDVQVAYEHFHRYLWAARVVEGRRVLDLGSGEGFGAAILAESAESVVGVDVDARTVEHCQLNYQRGNLEFELGTAVDLSKHASGSFSAVVAFEIIEHVREQSQVVSEVARVLSGDGILAISTPDRRIYSGADGSRNPFHEHELESDEFIALLEEQFSHVAMWGQRTITGSHFNAVSGVRPQSASPDAGDFFLERAGDEWQVANDAVPMYMVVLASNVPLPAYPRTSTLADCGLELMRIKERDTLAVSRENAQLEQQKTKLEEDKRTLLQEREQREGDHERDVAAIRSELAVRDRNADRQRDVIVGLQAEIDTTVTSLELELSAARQALQRTADSVTWQALQRARGWLYAALGDNSISARSFQAMLRLLGRILLSQRVTDDSVEDPTIVLRESSAPRASLIIPLHARADLTSACLRSILRYTDEVEYEVILVDDDADKQTKRLLHNVSGARVVRNRRNLGYLRSIARGVEVARGEWLVLCNNDIEATPGWLSAMLACADSADDIGIVTPKYVYPDGTLNEAGGIIWRDGTGLNYGRGDTATRPQYEYRREPDYGSGAALMVSSHLWEATGGFDERYLPMYYEDTDLCFEARERGLRVVYEPEATVVHLEGATAGTDINGGAKRYQEENRPKFVAKWRHRLDSEHLQPHAPDIRWPVGRHPHQHVLIVDYRIPSWDRDSGSLRMLGIVHALLARHAHVTLLPDNLHRLEPYTRALQRMGVEVLCGDLDIRAELTAISSTLDAAILCRPTVASRWLDTIRELAPTAAIAYDTVDLHWLREARRHAADGSFVRSMNGDAVDLSTLTPKATALRELELAMIRAADVTFVVSDIERLQVERDVPGSRVILLPNVHDIATHVPPPAQRSGILFVGGFAHNPNVDAAVKLVRDVMPAVWRELGDVRVSIVGGDTPPEVHALASPQVDVMGWIEDIQPLLDSSRLMLAPLSYGAGIKGKVTQCLAAGLPVVTTTIGAEGIEGDHSLLVADDPKQLAEHVVRLYRDDVLWRRLSEGGRAFITARCSAEVASQSIEDFLGHAALSRMPRGCSHIRADVRSASRVVDEAEQTAQ